MPRNSQGVYSLPAGNPVVTGTTIESTWANTLANDLASEITNSLDRNGRGGMLAPFKLSDGSSGAPAFSFTNEPTSGIYRSAAGEIAASILGTQRFKLTAAGGFITGALEVSSTGTFGDVAGNSFTTITGTTGRFNYTGATSAALRFDMTVQNGTGNATTQFNRNTNTTGAVAVQFLRGDGSTTADHILTSGSSGLLADFCRGGGYMRIGASSAAAASGGLVVSSGGAGITPNNVADELIVEAGGTGGISILTPAANSGFLLFGSPVSSARGRVTYDHATDTLRLGAASSSGQFVLTATDLTLSVEMISGFTSAPTDPFSLGFRGFGTPIGNTATATKASVGRVYNNTGAITINNSVFAAGDVVNVYNNSGTAFNITQGTITTLRRGGTTTTGASFALQPRGMASLYFPTATECVIFGDI